MIGIRALSVRSITGDPWGTLRVATEAQSGRIARTDPDRWWQILQPDNADTLSALSGPAQLGGSPSSRGDRSPSRSALHRRPNRTCVIGEVSDQTSLDLADGHWYPSSRTGSRAFPLTPVMSRQVTAFDNVERCQSGLSDDFVDGRPIL